MLDNNKSSKPADGRLKENKKRSDIIHVSNNGH